MVRTRRLAQRDPMGTANMTVLCDIQSIWINTGFLTPHFYNYAEYEIRLPA